jgi:DNA replication and repair protein RecF
VQVRAVSITNLRSWPQLSLSLTGSTVLLGGNGVGKTTVLEAIVYAATLRSHRTSSDQTLIRQGTDQAVIRVEVERATRIEKIELEINARGRNRAQLGGAPVSAMREIVGVLRMSLFAPERTEVIRGDPSQRRDFADELLVMLHPRYARTLKEYDQVVRQRNKLLRAAIEHGIEPVGIESWDVQLIELGSQICEGRARALEALAPFATQAYKDVGGDEFTVGYEPRCEHPGQGATVQDWARVLQEKLQQRQALERVRGTTLAGPHRDDLSILINDLPARAHASHGEGWLAALALSLAAHACISQVLSETPVLLLDDPFTLLDPARRERLVGALPQGQVLITAADPNEIPPSLQAERLQLTPDA